MIPELTILIAPVGSRGMSEQERLNIRPTERNHDCAPTFMVASSVIQAMGGTGNSVSSWIGYWNCG